MQIKQLQTSLEKEKKLLEGMQEANHLKQTETNKINQKLITIQKCYENKLKEVANLQDDVKRINKEEEGNKND